MRIVETKAAYNGSHRNQTVYTPDFPVPDGYAVIPDELVCENFPFGDIEVDYTQTPPVVTAWHPLPIPDPVPETPNPQTDTDELLVDLAYRTTLLELGLTAEEVI